MDLASISPSIFTSKISPQPKNSVGASDLGQQFHSFLQEAVSKLNEQQSAVNELSNQMLKGELIDVHQLMIASEKATLGLELTVQVRNKVVESYQEIMRMQI